MFDRHFCVCVWCRSIKISTLKIKLYNNNNKNESNVKVQKIRVNLKKNTSDRTCGGSANSRDKPFGSHFFIQNYIEI